MSTTLLRNTPLRLILRSAAPFLTKRRAVAGTFVRGKATLPDLPCLSTLPFDHPRLSNG